MNCQKCRILIMRKLDGETNTREERDLLQHLQSCPDCRQLQQDLEQILTGLEAEPSLGLQINPQLELKVLDAIRRIKYQKPAEAGVIRLIFMGLGLVFMGILLYTALGLSHSDFFRLLLTINHGLAQITGMLTTVEVLYRIFRPLVSPGLNTITQWVLSLYQGAVLVSIILLMQFVYIKRHNDEDGNYR